jgi:hypothetical protein
MSRREALHRFRAASLSCLVPEKGPPLLRRGQEVSMHHIRCILPGSRTDRGHYF